MRFPPRDGGVSQVIEAIMVGVIVLIAIGYAIASQAPPPPSSTASSENLEAQLWDAVEALDKMHYPDESYGNSTLSKAVADAAAGDPDPIASSLERFLPPGARFQVMLNNGYDQLALYQNGTPGGQAVGIAYPFEPNWRFHYGATDLRVYNANTSQPGMGLVQVPLFNSNQIQDEGLYVRAHASGKYYYAPDRGLEDPTDPFGRTFHEEAYTTLIQGNDTKAYPAASIYLECERSPEDQPCYAIDLTADPIDGYGPQARITDAGSPTSQRLDVIVENDGPGSLAEGTTLTVRFPVGLDVVENATSPAGLEDIQHLGSDPQPETVTASVATGGLAEDERARLRVWVNRTDDRYAYKQIDAHLSGGATSTSQLLALVQDKTPGTHTGADARRALVSSPRPAGAMDEGIAPSGRWAVVVPAPVAWHDVRNVSLEVREGDARVADVAFPDDFDPTWPSSTGDGPVTEHDPDHTPRTVFWEPTAGGETSHDVPAWTFVELQFNVTLDGTQTPAAPTFPPAQPRPEFTGYQPPPQSVQIEPGIWWAEHPPATGDSTPTSSDDLPGYAATGSDPSKEDPVKAREIENRISYRNTVVTGNATYRTAAMGDAVQGGVKDAVETSWLNTTPARVTPGSSVHASLHVRDVATYLSGTGGLNELSLNTSIYAPWGIPNRTPIETYTHHAAAGVVNAPKDLMPAWVDADASQDVLVAASDGNVYSLSGDSGSPILGKTFALPGKDPKNETSPTHLTRASTSTGQQIYGVGTTSGLDHWYSMSSQLAERWRAPKAEGEVATRGVNTSLDLTGDGIPELVASHPALDAHTDLTTTHASRLTVWNGTDVDGDGQGDLLPGWSWDFDAGNNGVVVPGQATKLGMAMLGARARPGVYANTGFEISDNADQTVNATLADAEDRDLSGAENLTFAAHVRGNGLVGFHDDGRRAWNFSGGAFVQALRDPALDTGGPWSGIVAADQAGWLYGFNASQPIPSVMGWTHGDLSSMDDVAMANPLEGYIASDDGVLMYTRDGWTTAGFYESTLEGPAAPEVTYPGVRAVDAPDATPYEAGGNVSWWTGDSGLMLRSTDRLGSVEELSLVGQLVGTVHVSLSEDPKHGLEGLQIPDDETVDLSKVNFNDVLALSPTEAWFVGEGIAGTSLDPFGYLVHATDGGDTLDVFRLECTDGTQIDGCGVNAIDADGQRLWVVGDKGLVLTQWYNGDASSVELTGSPGVNANGALALNLTADASAKLRNVTVGWTPASDLDWTRGVTLKDDGTHPDLWNKTEGGPYIEDKETNYDSERGAARNATLFVDAYVQNVDGSQDADRRLDGDGQLMLGPFKKTLTPATGYYDGSAYDGDGLTDLAPINFTVNVTYQDGSRDTYVVAIADDGSVTHAEYEANHWQLPVQHGFAGPSACFGEAEIDCTTYHGVNVTQHPDGLAGAIVGVPQADGTSADPQASIVRLAPGSGTFSRVWDLEANQTYRDVAINPHRPAEWVAVGDNGRVVKSFDAGATWTDLMTPAVTGLGAGGTLRAVDHTNPHSGFLVGGDQQAQQWTVGGYREYGRAATHALDRAAGSASGSLEMIEANVSRLHIGDATTGTATVEIETWDDGLDRWVPLYNTTSGWVNESSTSKQSMKKTTKYTYTSYTFAEPTDNLELRFTLSTDAGFSRFSPQLRGEMTIRGWTDQNALANVTIPFDVNATGDFVDLGGVEQDPQAGTLRLPGASNLWVEKLGNPDAGDWSKVASNVTAPRIKAAGLSPDGTTAYAGTGAIYNVEGQITTSSDTVGGTVPVKVDGEPAYDNSLYKIDARTGKLNTSWGPIHFDQPVQTVEVGHQAVYVHTEDPADPSARHWLYRIDTEDAQMQTDQDLRAEVAFEGLAIVDAFEANPSNDDDLVVGLQNEGTGQGYLDAYLSPLLEWRWTSVPEIKGDFDVTYEVPRNAMYGTYLVVTEFEWTVKDDFGRDVVQTARIHDGFVVTPRVNRVPLSPTYTLDVVAWMEDWG